MSATYGLFCPNFYSALHPPEPCSCCWWFTGEWHAFPASGPKRLGTRRRRSSMFTLNFCTHSALMFICSFVMLLSVPLALLVHLPDHPRCEFHWKSLCSPEESVEIQRVWLSECTGVDQRTPRHINGASERPQAAARPAGGQEGTGGQPQRQQGGQPVKEGQRCKGTLISLSPSCFTEAST